MPTIAAIIAANVIIWAIYITAAARRPAPPPCRSRRAAQAAPAPQPQPEPDQKPFDPAPKKRGRPRKNPLPDPDAAPTAPKKRGRPRKTPAPAPAQSAAPDPIRPGSPAWILTPDAVTIDGRAYAAGYSVTPSRSVILFAYMPDDTYRYRYAPGKPGYAQALAAAQAA